jgi:hypothetical protein
LACEIRPVEIAPPFATAQRIMALGDLARLGKVLTGHPHETLGIIASQPEKPPNIHCGAERLIIKAAVFAAMDLIAHLFSLTSAFVSKRSMSTHSSPSRFST